MHNIKWIEENQELFDRSLKHRSFTEVDSTYLLSLNHKRKKIQTELQEIKSKRNQKAKDIGKLIANNDKEKAESLKNEVSQSKSLENKLEQDARDIEEKLKSIMLTIPNILAEDTPIGENENDNLEVKRWGIIKDMPFVTKEHFDLNIAKSSMDFQTASKISGSRFVILKGKLAKLERALANFMLDTLEAKGLEEYNTPVLVRSESLLGTGQLPKFSEDSYKIENENYWLIPTAEVSLSNTVANDILKAEDLPLRLMARTECFRSEAGSAGKDTKGMFRQHQFSKVEMVTICEDGQDEFELKRMLDCSESILQLLEIPYRVVRLCTGDIGFSSKITYDIEVWLPGQNKYREISSCSTTGEFQARRMNARYRNKAGNKEIKFVNTLNGSALAIGRCIIAILENYQQEDGSVQIPKVLISYMNNCTKI